MSDLICDTSGLLAPVDRSDPMHADVASVVGAHPGPLVVSPLVLAELDYRMRARIGGDTAPAFADDVALGAYDIAPLTATTLGRCIQFDRRYADFNLGLTDCHVMVLADAGRAGILSLDHRHFRAVTGGSGSAFKLLPADSN